MASKRQTWALFCATGLDCRGLALSVNDASTMLKDIDGGHAENTVQTLLDMGASGKPKNTKDWAKVWQEAHEAGLVAGSSASPTPMNVVGKNNKGEIESYHVPDGPCGFAWVKFAGNTSFGKWAKKAGKARRSYPSGLAIWVSEFGQSYQRKIAYAEEAAAVLTKHGVKCYAGSRLD